MTTSDYLIQLQTDKSNLVTNLTTKGITGLTGDETFTELVPEVLNIPSGGSINIVNGIIEQYKAETSTISANTFVEFVNKYTFDTIGTDTQLSDVSNSYYHISAVALSDTKVFIAHRNGSYLYGIVCTINGTTITAGTDTQLSTGGTSYQYASSVALSDNKVFVAHRYGSYLYGIVCTIDGTTITAGTDTQLSTGSSAYSYASAVSLGENKVFVAYCYNSSYLGCIVCEINGTTITIGTETQLSTKGSSYEYASAVSLSENKVFVAHRNGGSSNSSYLNGIVCTIDGTTITAGTDTTISSTSNASYYASAVALNDNKVFVAHRYGSYLGGVVCTIDGTTITAGTDTTLVSINYSYEYASAVALSNNKIFIAHRSGSYLYGIVCTISGTTITAGTDTQLSTGSVSYYYASAVALSNSKVFIARCYNADYLGGIVCNISVNTIQEATTKINGLTKTQCTTSTTGDVWALN